MTVHNCKGDEKQSDTNRRAERPEKVERLMEEYNVQSKGKTLSGHFSPEEAIDVLETAASRGRSVSEIVTAAVRLGLPRVKKQFPRVRNDSAY